MAIHIPYLMEPYHGTEEQWQAYFAQQRAGLEYSCAYLDTISLLGLFSPRKNRRLKEARQHYLDTREAYWDLVLPNRRATDEV